MSLYQGKTILAPMVRVGNVGFRVFCAAQGADVVFSEEVVAVKLLRCRREVRAWDASVGQVVEFVAYENFKKGLKRTVAFATPAASHSQYTSDSHSQYHHPSREGAPVILQLGVASAGAGAGAASLCGEDVDGIDINMGCPKKFSVDNGMGAALMQDPGRAASIITAIDNALNTEEKVAVRGRRVPISFKTRLLETVEATQEMLIAIMEKVGPNKVHAITIHARTTNQTSETPPLYDRASKVVKELRKHTLFEKICFVLNGSVYSREDGKNKMAQFGFDAVMIARHAMWDMSVFSYKKSNEKYINLPNEPLEKPFASESWLELYRNLLRYQVKYRTPFPYFKYHLTRCLPFINALKHLMVSVQQEASSYEDIARIFGMSVEEQISMRGLVDVEIFSSIPENNFSLNEVCLTTENNADVDVKHCNEETIAAQVKKKLRTE